VKGKNWLRATLFSAAAAALPPISAPAQQPANGSTPAEITRQEFEQQRATLIAPPSEQLAQSNRDEAARRLLQRGEIDVLREALRGDRTEAHLAVARALADTESPPPQLLDELVLRLQPQISPDMAGAVALALTNYKDNALAQGRLRDFILSGNVSDRLRAPAVKALGTLNDKSTAQFLVDMLLRGDSPIIGDAAADALVEMTGQTEFGRDQGQWERWWRDQRTKTAEQFRNERLEDRNAVMRANASRFVQLAAQIEKFAIESFGRITDPKERDAYVLQNLKHALPEFRTAGASLVQSKFNNAEPIGPDIVEQLRGMISDSSPDVRKKVAGVIRVINDPGAAPMLLAQLQRERLQSVKEKLIEALAPSGDVAVVPQLIELLTDPSSQVAEAAARALGELGPELAKSAALTRSTAAALMQTVRQRTGTARGTSRLREACVEAMVPLHEPSLALEVVRELLPEREANTPNVRVAAVKVLANNNDSTQQSDLAGHLLQTLRGDSVAAVRLEAARALGIIGTPGQAEALSNAMDPGREADEAVREAAWNSLSSLFTQFDPKTLMMWKERFSEPEKRLAIHLTLNKMLVPLGAAKAADLAIVRQAIGTLYLDDKIDKPDEAVPYLAGALAYWDSVGQPMNTETIQGNIMSANLRSRKYQDAIAFATGRIQKNPQDRSIQQTMGQAVSREVARLKSAKRYEDAMSLLEAAKSLPIDPGSKYRDDFEEMQKEIKALIPSLHDLFPSLPRVLYV
jgi:HEAT repeat protein